MRKWYLVAVCLMLGFPTTIQAGESVLSTAGKVLQISPGPRWVAMGEASVAACDDIYSLFWNPAGLFNIRAPQISYMHNLWLQDIQDMYITYAQRMFKGGFAGSINYFNFGEFEKIDVDAAGYPLPTSETFTPYTMVITLGYGTSLLDDLDVGGSIKIVNESVDTFSAMTLALDLGAQYSNFLKGLDLGLSIQNLGVPLEGYGLPLTIKLGAAYKILNKRKNRFLTVVDVHLPIPFDQPIYTNLGLEYFFFGVVAARVGYKISEINTLGSISGITAGLGVAVMNFNLDYALAPFGDLGMSHRISVTYGFDTGKRSQKARRAKKRRAIKRAGISEVAGSGKVMLLPGKTGTTSQVMLPKMKKMEMRKSIYVEVDAKINNKIESQIDKATFKLKIEAGKTIEKWTLLIADAKGKVVKKYTGKGKPPVIEWNGKDKQGRKLKETVFCKYAYKIGFKNGKSQTLQGLIVKKPLRDDQQTSKKEMMPRVYFREGSADLSDKAIRALKSVAKKSKGKPYVKIVIEGYTDGVNEKSAGFLLSQRRAETVSRHLTATYKLPLMKISTHARGSKNPIASNQSEKSRRRNRRVEITIIYRQ